MSALEITLSLILSGSLAVNWLLYGFNKETYKEKQLYENRCSDLTRQEITRECPRCRQHSERAERLEKENRELFKFKSEVMELNSKRDFELEILRRVTYRQPEPINMELKQ